MSLAAGSFLIVEHDAASVEIACQWQRCMRGQVFLDQLDCDQDLDSSATTGGTSEEAIRRNESPAKSLHKTEFEIAPWQENSPWQRLERRHEAKSQQRERQEQGQHTSAWKKHFW